ncbi:MAG: hypothetical protein ACREQ5_02160 [Candidatus Dormibacteria bacterium]
MIARTGRNPFELWLLVACVLSGLGGLIDVSHTRVMLPGWEQYAWNSGLLICGVIGLRGAFLRRITGLVMERAALVTLALLCFAYSIAIVNITTVYAFGAVVIATFGVACLWRVIQITADLRRVDREDL